MDRREKILSEKLGRYLLKISDISHGTDAIPHAIKLAMDEYMKECVIEAFEFIAKQTTGHSIDEKGNVEFKYKGEWLSTKKLFENFL